MKRLVIFLLIITAVTIDVRSQNLSNPRSVVEVFVDNMYGNTYNPRGAAKIIKGKGLFKASSRNSETVEKLKLLLDERNVVLDPEAIPNDPDYRDPENDSLSTYTISDGIRLEKEGKTWHLASTSVEYLHDWHDESGIELPSEQEEKEIIAARQREARQGREQEESNVAQEYVDLSTPRKTVERFLDNTSPKNENYAAASRIIYYRHLPLESDRIQRVEQLDRFLYGTGVLLDPMEAPDDPNYIDTLNLDKSQYELTYRYPQLYLEKIGNSWYLSKESVDLLPELYNSRFPFGMDVIFANLPDFAQREIGSLKVWQYAGIFIIVLLAFLGLKLLNTITGWILLWIAKKLNMEELNAKYLQPVIKPMTYFIIINVVWFFIPALMLPVKVTHWISIIVTVASPVFFFASVYRLMDIIGLVLIKRAQKTSNSMDDMLAPITRKALKSFVVIIAFIFILNNLNIDIVPLLAGLSIGGLALALAAQDTIKQFFGSLMIFLDKPFQVGHWITSKDGIDGTVEEVGIRATRIRTFTNSLIYVPNGQLSDSVIDNHGLRYYRRYKTTISVTYDTPPEHISLFVEGLRQIVNDHPHTRKDFYNIYLNDFGPSSLDILFYIFFKAPTWSEELEFRHEIILSIIRLAHEMGVNFAFPTQTIHVENLPGQTSLSPEYEDIEELKSRMKSRFPQSKAGK